MWRNVYQLACPDYNKKDIGQTALPFVVRFNEHTRDYKYVNNKSKFAHLLDNDHEKRRRCNTNHFQNTKC